MSVNYRVKQRLQAALAQQSGGLLGLVNLFKKFDTDGSGSLSWEEFCSALQKCGLAPSPQDIRAIFLDLDKDGNNEISYQEFVHVMRGDMSNQRKALIKRVFDSIDEDGDGVISMTDLGKAFNPKNHPEVRSGRLTVSNLLKDFFESFSSVSNTGYVNLAQFMEYYANSAAFEDDIKFMDTMNSIWTIKSGGKSANTGNVKNLSSVTSSSIGSLISGGEDGVTSHLSQLREQLKTRGARGFIGLQRKFKIMDDDGNGNLNLVEFKKGIKESGLNLTDLQISQLFSLFDRDRSGTVDFDEFLVTVRVSIFVRYYSYCI
jgi:Ca2+-binding EF-hand superfamily protein